MNRIQKRVASAIAAGSILLQLATPIAASTTIVITGNGDSTDNDATVKVIHRTEVTQTNTADIDNDVDADANTGHNTASRNTGGNVLVDTGNADVDVTVSNTANSNSASVNGCCDVGTDVLISGNGADSVNDAVVTNKTETAVWQKNTADIDNDVDADADTGYNRANRNTGGDVEVKTGNAKINDGVMITNTVNSNSAQIGGASNGTGMLSARIVGNGDSSTNTIDATLIRSLSLTQFNDADIDNDVDADANTGHNTASRNTGGSVLVDTGDADVDVTIDNIANFNQAAADCDCILDALVKVAGNGVETDNKINATLSSGLGVFQDNTWECRHGWGWPWLGDLGGRGGHPWWGSRNCNDVDADADTGFNHAWGNTGDPAGDPTVETGDADVDVTVRNAGNSNVFGEVVTESGPDFSFPGFSFNLNLSFSLADLLGLFG